MSNYEGEVRRPAGLIPSGFAFFVATLWGGNNVSLKASLGYGEPMQVGWMRFILGGIVTLVYMVSRGEALAIARHEVKPLLVLGILFSVQLIIMNVGQDLTSAGHGVALNSTLPIWTATMARFFIPSDRLTWWKGLALLISYAGVLVVVFGDTGVDQAGVTVLGDVLSFIAAGLLGFRLILLSNFAQNVSEGKLMMGQLTIGTISVARGKLHIRKPHIYNEWHILDCAGISGICYSRVRIPGECLAGQAVPAFLNRLFLFRAAHCRRHTRLAYPWRTTWAGANCGRCATVYGCAGIQLGVLCNCQKSEPEARLKRFWTSRP